MRYVAAYLLSSLGGKDAPTAADIDKILSSVGIESDSERVSKVISELKGKNIEEVIAAGKEKLASVLSGGGAAPVATAGGAAPASASPAKAAEEKKEAKKEESDQSDDDMGFGLFD